MPELLAKPFDLVAQLIDGSIVTARRRLRGELGMPIAQAFLADIDRVGRRFEAVAFVDDQVHSVSFELVRKPTVLPLGWLRRWWLGGAC